MAELAQTPPLLWHYTSFKGLNGIVAEGELVASSLAYLNDTREFQYTISALLPLLDSQGVPLSDLVTGLFFRNVPSMVKAVFGHIRGQGTYVTCFSQEPDDLSQWRSYTPQPPGFAIGFEPHELGLLANTNAFGMESCRYPKNDELLAEIRATLADATAGMEEERKRLPVPSQPEALERFTEKWTTKIVAAMVLLAQRNKHPKFAAEKEVRLIGGAFKPEQQRAIQYRLSGSLIVPYIKIPARLPEGPSPIKTILVGPCPHQEAVIAVTRQMCIQHHVNAEVSSSAVPFRNW